MTEQQEDGQAEQMEWIALTDAPPEEGGIAERAVAQLAAIAQRTAEAAEDKKERHTTVTACVQSLNILVGKMRQEYQHHKDKAQRL